eukprot:TRINITY_DN9306_c0_g1_i3.p1 TRINITY_DN9306_c0_g1~~TRINITY_DN9306_c0_g1_i3.p1  ORF type:complete len:427 (+),score=100.14 TRINITY_DN9306_c0_g1_i3:213-1493(+)
MFSNLVGAVTDTIFSRAFKYNFINAGDPQFPEPSLGDPTVLAMSSKVPVENRAVVTLALSALAYESQEIIAQQLKQWGFSEATGFVGFAPKAVTDAFSPELNQAYVCERNNDVFVVFRGTFSVFDWISNFQSDLTAVKHTLDSKNSIAGGVHTGFWANLVENSMADRITAQLKKSLQGKTAPRLFITGHSLGGGLANLYAAYLAREKLSHLVTEVHAFAPPRIGDRDFVTSLHSHYLNTTTNQHRITRFVHHHDVVPRGFPNSMGFYEPLGRLIFLSDNPDNLPRRDMGYGEAPALTRATLVEGAVQWPLGVLSAAVTAPGSLPMLLQSAVIPRPLLDHFPWGYMRVLKSALNAPVSHPPLSADAQMQQQDAVLNEVMTLLLKTVSAAAKSVYTMFPPSTGADGQVLTHSKVTPTAPVDVLPRAKL